MSGSNGTSRLWPWALGFAGVNEVGMGLYHFVLPFHMGWGDHLGGVPTSITWALYTLNFSWSLLVVLTGLLVLHVARLGPDAGRFARRFVFVVGLFWLVHGASTWIRPFPMPASLAWLWVLLATFPVAMVAAHWAALAGTKKPA